MRAVVVATTVSIGFAATAWAAGNTVTVHPPTRTIHVGDIYKVVVSGHASGAANEVTGFAAGTACKSTYDAEYSAQGSPSTISLARPVSGNFSKTRRLKATGPGKVFYCAYLVNNQTTKTYAHSFAHWTQHK